MAKRRTSQKSATFRLEIAFRSRKALSPIFATLIILAVVTVLFIPVFIWATGITSQNQESWQQAGATATERIVIEEVNLRKGVATCTIYVRNIGTTVVRISNVLIYQADGTGIIHTYQGTALTSTPTSVVQGNLITLTISSLGFSVVSTTYNIKVATTRGVSDQYQVVVT
jgi:flagellin-like protein